MVQFVKCFRSDAGNLVSLGRRTRFGLLLVFQMLHYWTLRHTIKSEDLTPFLHHWSFRIKSEDLTPFLRHWLFRIKSEDLTPFLHHWSFRIKSGDLTPFLRHWSFTIITVLNDQCGSVRTVLSVRRRRPRFARPRIGFGSSLGFRT